MRGNFITQSRPTNFHVFFTRKVLLPGDTAENYMEVTPQERAAIGARDAEWRRPPQWVIDMFDADPNGCYNEDTGFGELNGLTDLTAREMTDICWYGARPLYRGAYDASCLGAPLPQLRTNLSIGGFSSVAGNYINLFANQRKIEVIRLGGVSYTEVRPLGTTSLTQAFAGCGKLREVIGIIDARDLTSWVNTFNPCAELRGIRLRNIISGPDLRWSPLLSPDSVAYMVEHAANTGAISIRVHADVYARLTDEDQQEWHAVLAAAAEKKITFIT